MRDALRDPDFPRQVVFGDWRTAVALAWVFVIFVAFLVLWFGLAAVAYGAWRVFHWPLELVRWIAQ